jgi:hypothetical protein
MAFLERDPGKDRRQQIPGGARAIEPRFLIAQDPDAGPAELVEVPDHRTDTLSAQTIERPDGECVELPLVPSRRGTSTFQYLKSFLFGQSPTNELNPRRIASFCHGWKRGF